MATIKINAGRIADPPARKSQREDRSSVSGLNKMHRVVELNDSAEVRGMIAKLPHMVEIVEG